MRVWLQIGWTFTLRGAVLAHAVQHHRHYRPQGALLTPQRRLQTAMEVLLAVYADFARRQPSRLAAIAGRIPGTGPAEVETVARQLARGGLLDLRGESGEETLVPVTPAENLRGAELVRLVLGDETLPTDTGRLAAEAVAAAGRSLDAGLDLARQTTSAISAPLPLALPDEPQEPAKPPAPAPR